MNHTPAPCKGCFNFWTRRPKNNKTMGTQNIIHETTLWKKQSTFLGCPCFRRRTYCDLAMARKRDHKVIWPYPRCPKIIAAKYQSAAVAKLAEGTSFPKAMAVMQVFPQRTCGWYRASKESKEMLTELNVPIYLRVTESHGSKSMEHDEAWKSY